MAVLYFLKFKFTVFRCDVGTVGFTKISLVLWHVSYHIDSRLHDFVELGLSDSARFNKLDNFQFTLNQSFSRRLIKYLQRCHQDVKNKRFPGLFRTRVVIDFHHFYEFKFL